MDNTARVVDAESGQLLLSLLGHSDSVRSVHYSPDGHRIVTASADNTARVWDAESGKLLVSLQGHSNDVRSASFSPDGRCILTASSDNTARIWNVAAEARSPEQLASLLRCRLALRLQGIALVSSPLEPAAWDCSNKSKHTIRRWDHRDSDLWIGIHALQAGHKEAARFALQRARSSVEHFPDVHLLVQLELAEASIDAEPDTPVPDKVADCIHRAPLEEQAAWLYWLTGFAQDNLYHPQWAIWSLRRVLVLHPSDSRIRAWVNANRLEVMLAMGQAAEIVQQGTVVWDAQNSPENRVVVAALVWLAACHQRNRKAQRNWANRVLQSAIEVENDASMGWNLAGSRHAFLMRPDSEVRTKALAIFTLLEQKKSPEVVESLACLLGLPATGKGQ